MNKLFLIVCISALISACQAPLTEEQQEALRIGQLVQSVDWAISHYRAPSALDTLAAAGTDSRHYTMVRGWLALELSGTQSQLQASENAEQREQLQAKVAVLTQAIRRIDLE